MDKDLFHWITTPVLIGVWLYIAIRAGKTYARLSKVKGLSSFLTKNELLSSKDQHLLQAVQHWKRTVRRLFLLWIITVVSLLLLAMLIGRTIGFR